MRGAPTEGSTGRQRRKKKGTQRNMQKGSPHRDFDALPPASIDTGRARFVPRASAACVCRQMSTTRVTYARGLQVADAPLARQPADAKPAALSGEGRSSAASA